MEKENSKKNQYDDNRKIDERIIRIDNELKDIMKSELNNYIEYLELVKNKEKMENDILVLMNVSNNMNRLDVLINQLKMDLKKIKSDIMFSGTFFIKMDAFARTFSFSSPNPFITKVLIVEFIV